jgi:hypothetical protein
MIYSYVQDSRRTVIRVRVSGRESKRNCSSDRTDKRQQPISGKE